GPRRAPGALGFTGAGPPPPARSDAGPPAVARGWPQALLGSLALGPHPQRELTLSRLRAHAAGRRRCLVHWRWAPPHRELTLSRMRPRAAGRRRFVHWRRGPTRGPQRGSRAGVASPPRTDAEPHGPHAAGRRRWLVHWRRGPPGVPSAAAALGWRPRREPTLSRMGGPAAGRTPRLVH